MQYSWISGRFQAMYAVMQEEEEVQYCTGHCAAQEFVVDTQIFQETIAAVAAEESCDQLCKQQILQVTSAKT